MKPDRECETTWLYLVRHGATEANERVPYILQGNSIDLALSPRGERQAQELAGFLRRFPIARVYTSALRRARQTAEAIGKSLALAPLVADDLYECNVGVWEGLDWGAISQRYPAEHRRFVDNPADNPYLGGESYGHVLRRSRPVIDRLIAQHSGESIVVVGHNVVNRVLLADMLGLPLRLAPGIPQGNGCVNLVKAAGASPLATPSPTAPAPLPGGEGGRTCRFALVTLNALFHLGDPPGGAPVGPPPC